VISERHRRGAAVALVAAAAVAGCRVQASRPAPQYEVTIHRPAPVIAAVRDSVTAVLTRALADSAFPGAIAVVGGRSAEMVEVAVGQLDRADSSRPDRSTLWDLASLTKVVGTTTAMMQLVDRGQVDLDAPVSRYLPRWTGRDKDRVTIRHLLTHSSGLPSFRAYDNQTHEKDSIAALMFSTALDSAPGRVMVYSDIGAYMAGRVIEAVSGKSLDVYLDSNVFKPLGMSRTMFSPPRALLADIAPTEVDPRRGGLVRGMVHDERAYYLGGVSAHAGLFSTAADLSRFARMLLHGGTLDRAKIVSAETLKRFTDFADSAFSNRALGWQKLGTRGSRFTAPAPAWGGTKMSRESYGHTGFTGTSIAIDPTNDVYIVLLTNRVNPSRSNNRIGHVRAALADAVMGALLAAW
jgi:CubicO group peptidase (beta-lactamase class C family)